MRPAECQVILQYGYYFIPPPRTNGSNLHEDCLQTAVQHPPQQPRLFVHYTGDDLPWCRQLRADHDRLTHASSCLRLVPQVGEAGQAQAAAHRLHPQPLVVRRNGARCHALQPLRNTAARCCVHCSLEPCKSWPNKPHVAPYDVIITAAWHSGTHNCGPSPKIVRLPGSAP